ncbi:hypothetical protein BDW69DRAFT_173929 [Aspergillus filifer]
MEHLSFSSHDYQPGPVLVISSRPSSTMTKVLGTPELFEMILAKADMRTLLIAGQRVCRTWKILMDESPSLQQSLFFSPLQLKSCVSLADAPITPRTFKQTKTEWRNLFFSTRYSWMPPHLYSCETKLEPRVQIQWVTGRLVISSESESPFARKDASWRRITRFTATHGK